MTEIRWDEMFEKSPQVAPLLVKLYESHKLYGLAKGDDILAKAELGSAMAELLEVGISEREQEVLTDILVDLMRQAEVDLRRALSERLSTIKDVPLRLALFLANDEISVAAPILRESAALSDLDLLYIIKAKGPAYWQAIAEREGLSAQIIDVLADTRDLYTAIVLSQNDRIKLTAYAMDILAEMAEDNEELARPLLMRDEIPQSYAKRLYGCVGEDLKAYINNYFGRQEADVSEAIDEVFLEFAEPEKTKSVSEYMPTEDMIKAADKCADMGMLTSQYVLGFLERGQIAQFIAMFAKYCGLPAHKVHDALKQKQPKGMVIACRAFGFQKNEFSRIYLLTHRMRSSARLVNQKDMLALLTYFDKVRPETARRIVGMP